MQVFKNPGFTVYQLCKGLCVVKKQEPDKIKFFGRTKDGKFFHMNWKFYVQPHKEFRYFHWIILTPFLYWDKHNWGYEIGLPNLYLWRIK